MTKAEEIFLMIIKNSLHSGAVPQAEMESAAVPEDTDWEAVLGVARKQNLFPYVYDAATAYQAFSTFGAANEQYFMYATSAMSAQMQRTEALLNLYQAFCSNGLEPIVIKGIICRSLYGERADFRPSGDEDILIEKKDYERAAAVLEACGYRKEADPDKEMTVVQEVTFFSENLMVELHLNLFASKSAIQQKMNNWFKDAFLSDELVCIKGIQMRTMTPTDHFLFLVFHAFNHFTNQGFGVRMMLDILLFAEQYEKRIDWEYIDRGLADVGATGFLADLVELGNEYLGFSLPQRYVPVCPADLLHDMFRMGIFGNSTGADRTAGRMVEDTVQEECANKRGKAASYFRLLFPSWKTWCAWRPYLKDKPWMVVPEWCSRIGRYLRGETSTSDVKGLDKSYRIAAERIALLKKYGVLTGK